MRHKVLSLPYAAFATAILLTAAASGPASATPPKQAFDLALKKPTLVITHQSPTPGTCFGGASEPCDVFQFTTNFSCGDCFADVTSTDGGFFFEIATSSDCRTAAYTFSASTAHMIAMNKKAH